VQNVRKPLSKEPTHPKHSSEELSPVTKRMPSRRLGAQAPSRTGRTAQAEHRTDELGILLVTGDKMALSKRFEKTKDQASYCFCQGFFYV
jgi:hypothetical protein